MKNRIEVTRFDYSYHTVRTFFPPGIRTERTVQEVVFEMPEENLVDALVDHYGVTLVYGGLYGASATIHFPSGAYSVEFILTN